MNNNYISGIFRKAHAYKGYEYKYFLPNPTPKVFRPEDAKLSRLLEEATHKLGELNAYARFVPDIDFFMRMHETKEATASNKIEGTQTNIDEALMREEDVAPERRDDWQEVQNYIEAMHFGITNLEKLPIVTRLLNETHGILLQGVRGADRQPGVIRTSQNWIGGASLKDARFIPPASEHLSDLLSDLEMFLNKDDLSMPLLIKAGIAHYQFETIHPYLDGNGRLGRLLIILFLIQKGLLHRPVLYISQFFEKNRENYYDALSSVRSHNDLEQWLKFFLVGVSETAENATDTLQSIMRLRQVDGQKIVELGRKTPRASKLIEHLYKNPVISVSGAARILGVSHQSANSLISDFERLGILSEITGFSRNRLYIYEDYIQLFTDEE